MTVNLENINTPLELNFIALPLPNLQFVPNRCQIPLSVQFQTAIICDTSPKFTLTFFVSLSQPMS